MITLSLTNKEWYFLHIQIEEMLKKNPDNHIAKAILEKPVDNSPSLDDIKTEFKTEYDTIWT